MQQAPIPAFEKERLEALKKLNILDTKPEERFDKITKEAMDYFKVPLSTISIVDENREWFKSCNGACDLTEGARDISFCGHALLSGVMFIIEDTKQDERFADNPYVVGPPYIRLYAGMRQMDRASKQPIGVFCIKDTKPRKLDLKDIGVLMELANRAEDEINKPQNK